MTAKPERATKKRDRVSAADLVAPAALLVLATTEAGSQGGVPVLDELTQYVIDEYDVNGGAAAVKQIAIGLDDLVHGAVSVDGAIIGVGAWAAHKYLKNHGRSSFVTKTRNHVFSLGG